MDGYSFNGRYMFSGGFFEVDSERIPTQFKKKKIIIENLDDEGNVLNRNMLSNEDKEFVLSALWAKHGPIIYVKEKFGQMFNEVELSLLEKVIFYQDIVYITDDYVMDLRALLDNHSPEKLSLVFEMVRTHSSDGYFNVHPTSQYFRRKFDFNSAIEFIEERSGIYFAIDKEGCKKYDFVDEPTRKQVNYQRNKGNTVVFLSFYDWKQHLVNVNDLRIS